MAFVESPDCRKKGGQRVHDVSGTRFLEHAGMALMGGNADELHSSRTCGQRVSEGLADEERACSVTPEATGGQSDRVGVRFHQSWIRGAPEDPQFWNAVCTWAQVREERLDGGAGVVGDHSKAPGSAAECA